MSTFADERYHAYLRDLFVGNETNTDQYSEAYPESGIDKLTWLALQILPGDPRRAELGELTLQWLAADPNSGSSAGGAEFEPIARLYFDLLWERGEHPYNDTFEDLVNDTYGDLAAFEQEFAEWQTAAGA